MRSRSGGLTIFLVVLGVLGAFVVLLYNNAQPTQSLRAIIPTEAEPTSDLDAWQAVLRSGFGEAGTLAPTIAIPVEPFIPPTLAPVEGPTMTPFSASDLDSGELFTPGPVSTAVTATPLPAIPTMPPVGEPVEVPVVAQATMAWNPPPLVPPLNRDPLGRDHYYFARPVDSNARNFGLWYYPYGSDGPEELSPMRIHHGIDMPNPIGAPVRAAGSGTVIFASSEDSPNFETSSYGNVVVIEHDCGWNRQPLWTLYAHMQSVLVTTGDIVEMGDPIGLVGNSGRVSGPHLHFEVRVGRNAYGSTYNPVLWMVPYVGHGVIAGRLVDERDTNLQKITVNLRNWATGTIETTTASYTFDETVSQVNSAPNWNENFAFGDVPVGRYEVFANYDGQRLSQIVEVREGITTFVELKAASIVTDEASSTAP
jgi:murein DD-endopeptidase MepM/ murein hydrolase activator NlpD